MSYHKIKLNYSVIQEFYYWKFQFQDFYYNLHCKKYTYSDNHTKVNILDFIFLYFTVFLFTLFSFHLNTFDNFVY